MKLSITNTAFMCSKDKVNPGWCLLWPPDMLCMCWYLSLRQECNRLLMCPVSRLMSSVLSSHINILWIYNFKQFVEHDIKYCDNCADNLLNYICNHVAHKFENSIKNNKKVCKLYVFIFKVHINVDAFKLLNPLFIKATYIDFYMDIHLYNICLHYVPE